MTDMNNSEVGIATILLLLFLILLGLSSAILIIATLPILIKIALGICVMVTTFLSGFIFLILISE